jgi:NTE family protein
MTAGRFERGFTLALGGGGARGWAHIGVARALEASGLRPTRIAGTSMGAIIGAGMAAGRTAQELEEAARRTAVYRYMRRPGRLALFDARVLLERTVRELGNRRIEELPTPFGVTTFDLVAGRPRLITAGPLVDALEMSIAVPFFLPPRRDADGVWCDAGPWEGIPVSLARAWDPALPVIGVLADIPKPAFLSSRIGAALLRRASRRLAGSDESSRLTARRYLSLVAARWADPVVVEPPDLLIAPRLGRMNALQFGRVGPAIAVGERDALAALATIGAEVRSELVAHGT